MSDLYTTKRVDGYPAKFIRFAGPENFVIEVNGAERIVTRDVWGKLPQVDASEPKPIALTGEVNCGARRTFARELTSADERDVIDSPSPVHDEPNI
jgi:hypothetical protein